MTQYQIHLPFRNNHSNLYVYTYHHLDVISNLKEKIYLKIYPNYPYHHKRIKNSFNSIFSVHYKKMFIIKR